MLKIVGPVLILIIGLVLMTTVFRNYNAPSNCNPPYHQYKSGDSIICCHAYVNGQCS